ncbi:hypothetical protein GCM10010330_38220 [Streptomyces tendae]|nr:hypothetical protein GCM10010330_38220 [Streptomyces tendae]
MIRRHGDWCFPLGGTGTARTDRVRGDTPRGRRECRCRVLGAGRMGDVQYEGDEECRRREPVRPEPADAVSVAPPSHCMTGSVPRHRPGQPARRTGHPYL